jgi:hypothetical protein
VGSVKKVKFDQKIYFLKMLLRHLNICQASKFWLETLLMHFGSQSWKECTFGQNQIKFITFTKHYNYLKAYLRKLEMYLQIQELLKCQAYVRKDLFPE